MILRETVRIVLSFFLFLFIVPILGLFNLEGTVYPYYDAKDSLYPYVVSRDALGIRIIFIPIVVMFEVFVILLFPWINKAIKNNTSLILELVSQLLRFVYLLVFIYSIAKYIQLWNIQLNLVHCDKFSSQTLGCYIR